MSNITNQLDLTPQGLYLCPLSGCRGNIIWHTEYDIAISGNCNYCDARFTLLMTELPKPKEAKTDG